MNCVQTLGQWVCLSEGKNLRTKRYFKWGLYTKQSVQKFTKLKHMLIVETMFIFKKCSAIYHRMFMFCYNMNLWIENTTHSMIPSYKESLCII